MKNYESIANNSSEQVDQNTDSFGRKMSTMVSQYYGFMPESDSQTFEENAEILESSEAKNILPYLTLDLLSDAEKASLITLAGESFDFITQLDGRIESDRVDYLFGSRIAERVGLFDEFEDNRIPRKLGEARKLFCASILNRTKGNPRSVESVYDAFFSYAPDFASYCGGLSGSLELLGISETLESPRFADNIAGEIIYDHSYNDYNAFADILKKAPNNTVLGLLPTMYHITQACDIDNWDNRIIYKVSEAVDDLTYDNTVPPLTRIVAESISEKIDHDINTEWVTFELDDPKYADLVENNRKLREDHAKQQQELHNKFPLLPSNRDAIKISPGVAATFGARSLEIIVDENGNRASLHQYESNNALGIDQESSILLRTVHDPDIKQTVDELLGLDLSDISLPAQIQLLKFMTEAGDKRFDKLCATMHDVNPKLRLKLAEGFLVADFGEDFGDSLLTIAKSEKLSDDEKERFFDTISSCRESINKITGLYSKVNDGEFMKEYARATNERLTDATTVFSQIAEKGVAETDLDWAGQPKFDYNSAMEALKYEARSLEIISGTLGDVNSGEKGAFAEVVMHPDPLDQRLRRTVYNFYSPSHGYVLLYTRPEGSHSFDPMVEYGKMRSRYDTTSSNVGVEASISLITNPVDPFSLPSPFKPDFKATKNPQFYDISTMNKVSAIRLDREGRAPGMPADDPNRDPINLVGMVSVDLAAIGDREDTPSGKIARLLSTGGKLREASSSVDSSLNHNTKWFDQNRYGTSSGFKSLVNYVDTIAKQWCNEHTPENSAQSFTRLMKQARGRKASGRVA